ncbi:MBL fold metallo-hydrolase [Vreelandella malpeensis]|uniref:Ribonuclease Z n=1 Tax=Vreelandella malpeensis TaxID=1172368 RepID=A0ABS8DRM3_9GAMM|nr:MBL fold metallo-hydrolase [Halomonas malpeensis]MCB8888971.1 MBL fold metallo-hydrolase [Halomonas malpeensis]
MNLLFLGTSAGTPTKQRNFSGLALRERRGKGWYLIDCGEATQHQLLHTPLSLHGLRAILITHMHGDHCYGLPGLLASASMNGRVEPLLIVAPEALKAWLLATFEATQVTLSFSLAFQFVEALPCIDFETLEVSTTRLSHGVDSYAYSFTEKPTPALDTEKLIAQGVPRGPLWGQLYNGENVEWNGEILESRAYLRMTQPPGKIVVAGDNDCPALLASACEGAQVLVHEATYTAAMADKAAEVRHSYAGQVAAFAESVALPHLVLTHFSPRYQSRGEAASSIEAIRQEAQEAYTGTLYLARDFAEFSLDKAGRLTELSAAGAPSAT